MSNKKSPGSITKHLSGVLRGDEQAINELFQRIYSDLEALARRKYGGWKGRANDESDLLQQAVLAFCEGIENKKIKKLNNREHLWALFNRILGCRFKNQLRHDHAKKRGEGKTKGESVFEDAGAEGGLQGFAGSRDDVSMVVVEGLELLDDQELMQIALFRLGGRSDAEITAALGIDENRLKRKLRLIESIWDEWSRSAPPNGD